jgi:hypothetical protein
MQLFQERKQFMPSRHLPILVLLSVSALLGQESSVCTAEPAAAGASRPAIHGILYNEDGGNCCTLDPPGVMKPERLDTYVDELANSQVTIMLLNVNAKTTTYPSKVWDVEGAGFDPAKDNSQPYFGDESPAARAALRPYIENLRKMLDAGVDPTQRMIDRCRKRKISPWVSIRMNDIHDVDLQKSPLHSRFWMEHPEWRNSANRSLNYGIKPVRDHMMALIREVCDRFDMDGLELDWNRFPLHFRLGEEIEQGKVLTEWLVEVREVIRAAAKKWKHPIYVAARVPARPEVSMGTGLDAVTWAKRGLIDHLIVAPFFMSTDFDVPVERWIELLKGTGVGVTVGLEQHVRIRWNAEDIPNTPELRRGAAMAALARGSQGIYLFNYFEIPREHPSLLKEMGSVDTLVDKDRSYAVTYVDINIPNKEIPPPLPRRLAPGESAEFSLFIGPKPLPSARCKVQLTLVPEKPAEKCIANVMLNGQSPAAGAGFAFAPDAFREGYNKIRVSNAGTSIVNVRGVELSLRFPSGGR